MTNESNMIIWLYILFEKMTPVQRPNRHLSKHRNAIFINTTSADGGGGVTNGELMPVVSYAASVAMESAAVGSGAGGGGIVAPSSANFK